MKLKRGEYGLKLPDIFRTYLKDPLAPYYLIFSTLVITIQSESEVAHNTPPGQHHAPILATKMPLVALWDVVNIYTWHLQVPSPTLQTQTAADTSFD